jgi:hypothetical protein
MSEPMINRHERLGTAPPVRERLAVQGTLRDDVFESSAESFPASDSPSWSGMRAGPPDRFTGPLATVE